MYTGRRITRLFGTDCNLRGLRKIPQAEPFVYHTNPGPFQLVVDSTNPAPTKRSTARATGTTGETDEPNVTFTAADIAQQKVTHEESLHQYLPHQFCQIT